MTADEILKSRQPEARQAPSETVNEVLVKASMASVIDLIRAERSRRIILGEPVKAVSTAEYYDMRNTHNLDAHKRAQDDAQRVFEAAAVSAAARERKRREEETALILLLLLLAGEEAYAQTTRTLAAAQGLAVPPPEELESQAQQFAQARQPLLTGYAEKLSDALEHAAEQAEQAGLDSYAKAKSLKSAALNASTVMVETEAEAVYGGAQIALLKSAGFITKIWATCEDEKVRPTHVECEAQGEVGIDAKFSNGLLYPGDPNGGPEEVCNCRCWLVGGRRAPGKALYNWDEPGVPLAATDHARASMSEVGLNLKRPEPKTHGVYRPSFLQRTELRKAYDELKHPRDKSGHWQEKFQLQDDWHPARVSEPVYKSPHSAKVKAAINKLSSYEAPIPRPVAGAIIVNHEGKILLGRSNFAGQGWFFPKGGVDEGETIETAAAREAREETGIHVGAPVSKVAIPIQSAEHYSDSLGFGSPRHQFKDKTLGIAKGAADLIEHAAHEAGLSPEELAGHRNDIFDDLAGTTFVRWASEPSYHVYSVHGTPGNATDEVEEVKWVTPQEARMISNLHGHAAELVNHPYFDTMVSKASKLAPIPVSTAPEDYGLEKSKNPALAKAGYYHGTDPDINSSVEIGPTNIFVTRMDAVTPGQGAGSRAMEQLKRFATATGRTIELTAGADTAELQPRLNAFYTKQGFKQADNAEHPRFVWMPEGPVQATDHAKFHGNQYVDVPGAFKVMTDAMAHFKSVQSTKKHTHETAGWLLKSRAAFKSIPHDHPQKPDAAALGAQVVTEGFKAGVQYTGGGTVSARPDKIAGAKSATKVKKPALPASAFSLVGDENIQPEPENAPNEPQGTKTGHPAIHATPLTEAGKALNAARVAAAAKHLAEGTAVPDAVLQVIASNDPAKMNFIKAISTGPMKNRALTEFKDTPLNDIAVLSEINVKDEPLAGQAVCYMNTRKIGMGSTSVTGDFRHELGHAIHASFMGSPLDEHVQKLHAETLAKVKANPAGIQAKLTHEFYETTYGVIGRRALDNDKEDVAEHYRGYHKAVYRTRTGEDPQALAKYKERFPGWAKLWDAHYSAQLTTAPVKATHVAEYQRHDSHGNTVTVHEHDDKRKIYYHGHGRDVLDTGKKRISTGNKDWDDNFFVSHKKSVAQIYGDKIDKIEMKPDSKILVEGSDDYKKIARGIKHPKLIDHHNEVLSRAKKAGFHVVEFHGFHDAVGHVILDKSQIHKRTQE